MSENGVSSCWGRASHCPDKGSGVNQSSCEAWYRCDDTANYVISWRCQGTASSGSVNSAMDKCDNSSKLIDTELCPPPVVCPNPSLQGTKMAVRRDDVIDVDMALASVLALVALIALVLMVVATCKFWTAKKRLRRRLQQPSYRHFKAFASPTRSYQEWLAWDRPHKPLHRLGGTGNRISYSDIYVPYQLPQGPYLQQRADTPKSSNNQWNWTAYPTKKPPKVKRVGKVAGNPSVLTRSFIYRPNMAPREPRGANIDRNPNWSNSWRTLYHPKWSRRVLNHGVKGHDAESTRNTSPASESHRHHDEDIYFRGDNHEIPTQPMQYFVQPPSPDSSRTEFKPQPSGQISSIHIPSYDNIDDSNLRTPYQQQEQQQNQQQNQQQQLVHGHSQSRRCVATVGDDWGGSWKSASSATPYTMTRLQYNGSRLSEAASIASKNWHYTVFSRQGDVQTRRNETVSSTIKDTVLEPSPNSPDVISSHNLSRHVTHIVRESHGSSNSNIIGGHESQHGQQFVARITVPNYNHHHHRHHHHHREIADEECGEDKLHVGYDAKHCHLPVSTAAITTSDGDSDSSRNSAVVSYDRFRNEHLRQLTRQGDPTSSSTLDKGVGHIRAYNSRDLPFHF